MGGNNIVWAVVFVIYILFLSCGDTKYEQNWTKIIPPLPALDARCVCVGVYGVLCVPWLSAAQEVSRAVSRKSEW